MAVDLFDLVESLKREVSTPGSTVLGEDDEYLGHLQDSFWEVRLDGMLAGYVETDGSVSPISGTTELGRDLQQLVVLYAGIRIVRNELRQLKTVFRSKAGPVEFETQQAATVLTEILKELREKRHTVLSRLSDLGSAESFYIDAVIERDLSQGYGDTWWVE